MSKEDKYRQIEDYLNESLSEKEMQSLKAKMVQDPDFHREVELHQEMQETLKNQQLHDFRHLVREVDQNWKEPDQEETTGGGKIINLKGWWSVATIAALLAGALLIYTFLFQRTTGPADLYAANFQPYPMLLNERSGEAETTTVQLSEAIQAYANADYSASIAAFQYLRQQEETPAYSFYLALSYLGNQQSTLAIPLLKQLSEKKDNAFLEQSRWYLALAYLQAEKIASAKLVLTSIPEGGYQFEAAQELLEKL